MSVIHIAEHEIAEKLPGLLTRVKAGDEIVIDTGSSPILVAQKNSDIGWTAATALQRLANRTLTVVDQDFATDLADIRNELNANYRPTEWD